MTAERLTFLMAAGATGGHVMPAVAIARAIEAAKPDSRIVFVGTGRPAEAAILDKYGWERRVLELRGLKGMGIGSAPGALWQGLKAFKKAVDLVRELRPHVGIATGGYVAGPVGLAVRLSGSPLVIHEQNSLPGLTNRLLGLFAPRILLAFPDASTRFPAKRAMVVGNPVRPEIADAGSLKRDYRERPLTLVVLGGSQGSKRINEGALALVKSLGKGPAESPLRIIHQTGAQMEEQVRSAYKEMGIEAEVKSFFSDMDRVYKSGHLAICRAGALTIFELAAARLPAILVPLPTAADDHQSVNAKVAADLGLARIVKESEIDSGALAKAAAELLENPSKLEAMGQSDLSSLEGLKDEGSKDLAQLIISLARLK